MKKIILYIILITNASVCIGRNHLFDSYEEQMTEYYGRGNGPSVQGGIQGAYEILYEKFEQKTNHSISFSPNDWSSNIFQFVKVNCDNIPILSHTNFKEDNLHVIGFTKANEILQYIETKNEYVKIVNPLSWELQNFGDWYQVKTLNGEYGWIYAKPYGLDYIFASVVEKVVPKSIDNGNVSDSNSHVGTFILIALVILGIIILISSVSSTAVSTSNSYSDPYSSSQINEKEKANRILGHVGLDKRVNPKTGVIQEKGIIGWLDTDKRIDSETGKYQEKGLIGWNDTETRINQDSGIIQEKGLFGYSDTDTRINPESGVIQEKSLLGWFDTDRRIDTETGKSQHKGLIGWLDD